MFAHRTDDDDLDAAHDYVRDDISDAALPRAVRRNYEEQL